MKTISKSQKLCNAKYVVRGPVAEEAERIEAEGKKVLKLNIGNPAVFGFTSSEEILNELRQSAFGAQAYSAANGIESARAAILEYAKKKNIPNVDMEDIYTGNGASEMIQIALEALLSSGDEILIPSPDYPLWTAAATIAGGKVVHYTCDESSDWYPDLKDIESKIMPNTKAIVIINPNNPTGAVYPREILEGIADIARRHELIVFSDEIYDRLLLDGDEHISIASLCPDLLCVTMNGLSKSHMLCGFRIGWMILSGNKETAQDYIDGIKMLTDMRLCSNVPGQSVIAKALQGTMREERYFADGGRVKEQRDTVYSMLNEIPGISAVKPRAAFYIFPKIDTVKFNITDDRQFAIDLLREKNILIVPGSGFNHREPDHFRIVYLPEKEVLEKAMNDIGDFMSGYNQIN